MHVTVVDFLSIVLQRATDGRNRCARKFTERICFQYTFSLCDGTGGIRPGYMFGNVFAQGCLFYEIVTLNIYRAENKTVINSSKP